MLLGEWPSGCEMVWQWRSCESFWLSACLFKELSILRYFGIHCEFRRNVCRCSRDCRLTGCFEDEKSRQQCWDLSGVIVSRDVNNWSCVQIRELLWGHKAQGRTMVTEACASWVMLVSLRDRVVGWYCNTTVNWKLLLALIRCIITSYTFGIRLKTEPQKRIRASLMHEERRIWDWRILVVDNSLMYFGQVCWKCSEI